MTLLLAATVILCGTAVFRGAEYDEGYTVFLANGTPRPDWPALPVPAATLRGYFGDAGTPAGIAADLRRTDVHPPLYFWAAWAWRRLVGLSLPALRLLSVVLAVAGLWVVGTIARAARTPAPAAMLFTLGSYGFAYTGQDARGFALAMLLSLLGVRAIQLAGQDCRLRAAAGGGLLLGLATFTNYLALFTAAAALLWLLLRRWRRPPVWLAAGLGFAALLPADLWFFLAQRGSRTGQFPPFHLGPALGVLARDAAGSLFGGLPLYVPAGVARTALAAALAALLLASVALIALRWRRIATPPDRALFALAAIAPPAGLLALGAAFDNTPIELRYLVYAVPFYALLLAGALASLRPGLARPVATLIVLVQAGALAGLAFAQPTMQPQARATRDAAALAGPQGVVLVPRGNDGVGVVGAVLQSAPGWLRLLAVPVGTPPDAIRAAVAGAPRVVVAAIGVDRDSRATIPVMQSAFADSACWRQEATRGAATAYVPSGTCPPSPAPAPLTPAPP